MLKVVGVAGFHHHSIMACDISSVRGSPIHIIGVTVYTCLEY